MKVCTKCELNKPFEEYHKGSDRYGLQSRCKDCQKLLSREREQRQREIIQELKRVPCAICNTLFPSVCMDFHHRDPKTKLFSIGPNMKKPMRVLLEEIAKCDVVCSNCHRILEFDSE